MTSDGRNGRPASGRNHVAGSRMLADARGAPAAVARLVRRNAGLCRALVRRLRETPPAFAVTCARGSSDSAATYAKYLFEIELGIVTASVGPSVRSIYRAEPHMAGALFLAISQSGRSPDLLALTKQARTAGALTVAIVNDVGSPLAGLSEAVLPLRAGAELSVAATKSYIASLAAILQLAATWTDDVSLLDAVERLPDDLEAALKADWQAAMAPLRDATGLYVVGRGPGLAVALEAALKLKEACGLHAEAISAAELMHGPLALAGPDFPVLAFSPGDDSQAGMGELVGDLLARGVPTIVAGPTEVPGAVNLGSAADVSPRAQPIMLAASFHVFAHRLAKVRGRDPDHPPHLVKVTKTL